MSTKAYVTDLKRFAVHDGDGIRTTVFLKGCPLHCVWCHNPEGISCTPQIAFYADKCIHCGGCTDVCPVNAHRLTMGKHIFDRERCIGCGRCADYCLGNALQVYGRQMTVADLLPRLLEDKDFYAYSNGGVTVSGGEPLLHVSFVKELFTCLHMQGISTALDTSGFAPWTSFAAVMDETDLFLYDIKHIDSAVHQRITGVGNEVILENLIKLCGSGKRVEIRMPLVPGYNDDCETLQGIGKFVSKLTVESMKLLPYHSAARGKYMALEMQDTLPRVQSPDEEALSRAVHILREYGVPAISVRE